MRFSNILFELLHKIDQEDGSMRTYGMELSNEVFEVYPYCWCEKEECKQCGSGEQANFLYKPTGLEIRWYKYPLRDAYFNKECTEEQFEWIIEHCLKSLMENK